MRSSVVRLVALGLGSAVSLARTGLMYLEFCTARLAKSANYASRSRAFFWKIDENHSRDDEWRRAQLLFIDPKLRQTNSCDQRIPYFCLSFVIKMRKMTKRRQKLQISHLEFDIIRALRHYAKNYACTTIFFSVFFFLAATPYHVIPCNFIILQYFIFCIFVDIVYLSLFHLVWSVFSFNSLFDFNSIFIEVYKGVSFIKVQNVATANDLTVATVYL